MVFQTPSLKSSVADFQVGNNHRLRLVPSRPRATDSLVHRANASMRLQMPTHSAFTPFFFFFPFLYNLRPTNQPRLLSCTSLLSGYKGPEDTSLCDLRCNGPMMADDMPQLAEDAIRDACIEDTSKPRPNYQVGL
ncbi:unnamed protein product [Protopolystoma xenopodis]|uniref:Uncharacterized protein n=1 Tax=Protopolystoma xenopodis TaxID=117903 RepID=A0A3S5AKA5_9PLAT|nr:unnamed protein product [Protopolystoma xenopodis]